MLNNEFMDGLKNMGQLYIETNKNKSALEVYSKIVLLNPNDLNSKFLLTALKGENPETPPISFIENLFDSYANDFEEHLIDQLNYKTPAIIFEKLNNFLIESSRYKILDLGCGTGLAGMELKKIASEIVGVDISSEMLQKASEKKIYKQLIKKDIIEFIENNKIKFDVIVASDVFNYFGNLSKIFENIRGSMNKSGILCFTVESWRNSEYSDEYKLQINGRYMHSRNYVEKLINLSNIQLIEVSEINVRNEKGIPVDAFMFICSVC